MLSVVLCHFECCNSEGDTLPATRVLPQSSDQGRTVNFTPSCDTHAAGWWDGADWEGSKLEKPLMDVLTLQDFVAYHGYGDATQEGIQLAQALIAAGDDYATAASEVTARGLTNDPDDSD